MIIPVTEALEMQAAKQKHYLDNELSVRLDYMEKRFNYDVRNAHKNHEYVEVNGWFSYEEDGHPNGMNKQPEKHELLTLIERIKAAGYYVEKEQYSDNYGAYFKHPKTLLDFLRRK
jgi:hypothetical protein